MGRQQWVYRLEPSRFPEDFPQRLVRFKEAAGFSWRGLARELRVDIRQLKRWRNGASPGPGNLVALFSLAARMGAAAPAAAGGGKAWGVNLGEKLRRTDRKQRGFKAGRNKPSGLVLLRPPSAAGSPPDHPLGVAPSGPAVQGAVQDTEGGAEVCFVHPLSGQLLLPEQGVGHEAGRLEQAVAVGVPESRAANDSPYGDVAGLPAVVAGPLARGEPGCSS